MTQVAGLHIKLYIRQEEQDRRTRNACKKRKTGKESTFAELEVVLFTWYQQAWASNIPIDGTILREKAKTIAAKLNIH
jgi:hypothetical protein